MAGQAPDGLWHREMKRRVVLGGGSGQGRAKVPDNRFSDGAPGTGSPAFRIRQDRFAKMHVRFREFSGFFPGIHTGRMRFGDTCIRACFEGRPVWRMGNREFLRGHKKRKDRTFHRLPMTISAGLSTVSPTLKYSFGRNLIRVATNLLGIVSSFVL